MRTLIRWTLALAVSLGIFSGGFAAPAHAFNPGPVTNVTAVPGNGTLQVSWTAANGGSSYGTQYTITRYLVRATTPGTSAAVTCEAQATTCTLRGLENGRDYYIQITAYNNIGFTSNVWNQGPFRPCCSAPSSPASVAATAGDATGSVSWTPPANATQSPGPYLYTVTSNPAGAQCTTGDLTCSFTGLVNGTSYVFLVVAANQFGTSAPGTSAAVKPLGLPGPPLSVVGFTRDRGTVEVTWAGPQSTGGAPVTQYVATASPGGANCVSPGQLTCTITGLSNGVEYTFTVIATNQVGPGPASAASPVAKPLAGPGQVVGIKAAPGRNSVRVSWKEPKSTGGLKVSRYVVTASPGGRECTTKKTSCVVTGLADDSTYQFSVVAFNSKGRGVPASSNAVTTPPKPDAAIS